MIGFVYINFSTKIFYPSSLTIDCNMHIHHILVLRNFCIKHSALNFENALVHVFINKILKFFKAECDNIQIRKYELKFCNRT